MLQIPRYSIVDPIIKEFCLRVIYDNLHYSGRFCQLPSSEKIEYLCFLT